MKYPCCECGKIVEQEVEWIDSGAIVFCPECDGKTIVNLWSAEQRDLVSMQNKIFRTFDKDGDIWCEKAIVFQEDRPLTEIFTEENMRRLFEASAEDYPDVSINIVSDDVVKVEISHPEELYTDSTFYEMDRVLIL